MVLLMVALDLGILPALAGVATTLLLIPIQVRSPGHLPASSHGPLLPVAQLTPLSKRLPRKADCCHPPRPILPFRLPTPRACFRSPAPCC